MLDRRGFLASTAGFAGVLALRNDILPALASSPQLPDRALYNRDEQSKKGNYGRPFDASEICGHVCSAIGVGHCDNTERRATHDPVHRVTKGSTNCRVRNTVSPEDC